ncbi:thymidylate kinase [Anabrus simplex]|uniref:thymidylate kinase n=1 Tax=Anabrus simplex TaxID=316456 RepID=UPI0035A324EF
MCARGALIVLEGCDRAGKSTQCKKLVAALTSRGILAESLTFPDRSTATGKLIDAYLCKKLDLTDQAIHLLFSANRWELEPTMKKQLNNGVTLIVDRYSFSGIAFSAAKKGMDIEWCSSAETGLPKPDLVLFLNLSPDVVKERGGFGEERYEISEFQEKVLSNYMKLLDKSWEIINADQDVESVHKDLLERTLIAIEKAKITPLGQLW